MGQYQVIVLAAGQGKRMNLNYNKQFIKLGQDPMIVHTLKVFENDEWCQAIYLVVHPNDENSMRDIVSHAQITKVKKIVHGGAERQDSVYQGIKALEDQIITFIHDGARPFVEKESLHELYVQTEKHGAAFLAVKVTDTIKQLDGEKVTTLDRSKLYAAQTPQAFTYEWLIKAHEYARENRILATDDVALLEELGHSAKIVEGSYGNFKVTTPDDIQKAENMLQINRLNVNEEERSLFRIGQGFDVHQLVEGRPCIIGGVNIPFEKGLAGHSDADVLLHTITDAALGAIGEGDIGKHFPDTDPKYKDADSKVLLQEIWKKVLERGYVLGNLDCTIIAQAPKMAPYIDEMKTVIANLLQVDESLINIKATTTEKLGFTGRQEGIAAQAVILLMKK